MASLPDSESPELRGSGHHSPLLLKWCRCATIAWSADSSGFYYQRYPTPESGEDTYQHCRLYWHSLGKPQLQDEHVYELSEAPELGTQDSRKGLFRTKRVHGNVIEDPSQAEPDETTVRGGPDA